MRADNTGGETTHAALDAPKLCCRACKTAETALDAPKMIWTGTRETRTGKTADAALETANIDAPTTMAGVIISGACTGGGFCAHAASTALAGGRRLFLLLFHGGFHGLFRIAAADTPTDSLASRVCHLELFRSFSFDKLSEAIQDNDCLFQLDCCCCPIVEQERRRLKCGMWESLYQKELGR